MIIHIFWIRQYMYNDEELIRIKSIKKKLDSIFVIIKRHDGIVKALEDKDEAQPAVMMLLIAIAEQFNKLQKNDADILENFDSSDLKGISSVRNFIAHDYDGINLQIIEDILRYKLPKLTKTVDKII